MYPSERQSPRPRRPKPALPRARSHKVAGDLRCDPGGERRPIVNGAESLSDAFLSDCILRCDRSLASALLSRDALRREYQEFTRLAALEEAQRRRRDPTCADPLLREIREQQRARFHERLHHAELTCSYLHEGFVAVMKEALSREVR